MSATELRDRLVGQVAVLELIDRRREREGPSIGSAIEQRIVDEALVAVESATRDGLLGPGRGQRHGAPAMTKPLEGDAYWEMLDRTARLVDTWPDWKKGVVPRKNPSTERLG